MALTILIDLDNTLLGNDMDTFLPAYLQRLGHCLSPYAEPASMVKSLLHATQRMIENNQPNLTLKEVFDSHFYPSLNLTYESVQETLAQFYSTEYPHFQQLTRFRPEAVSLVKYALQENYPIAVATNPLFPATAIYQRLAWAGLSPTEIPFDHITTYENAHFAKPNPAYYAEILAYLGWPESLVVMVGDDIERDILPAQSLGIASYWVNENGHSPGTAFSETTASGSLAALIPWLEQTNKAGSLPSYNTPTAILATLRATPAVLSTQLSTLSPAIWESKLSPAHWSLTETLCHMRDAEKSVNLPRLKQILREDNPFLTGVDTDSWVETHQYQEQVGLVALQEFISARLQTLAIFDMIKEEDWQRPARHSIFGPTTFLEISHFMAEHDRLHLRQIRPLISMI